jgi:hypothetical protein
MTDLALLFGGFLIGILFRRFRAGRDLELRFNRLAHRKSAALLICAAVAVVPRIALLPWLPIPLPKIHDEFSYILGAQTLVAGRLTNPTPPMWQHFESFHINMTPSYQSMYPPATAAFYALGIVAGGHPWWGVCFSVMMMCAAVCWALQPIVGPRYAFLAGLFCALKYGVYSIFSDWYLGGAVAAFGSALILGAFMRLPSGAWHWRLLWLVTGIAILANSRPFEGLLFVAPIAAAGLIWMIRRRRWRMLASAAALLAVMFAAMGYYNLRGTGAVLKPPYVANLEQYHFVAPFLGMKAPPRPQYRHPEMAAFYEEQTGTPARLAQSVSGIFELIRRKIKSYYDEHFAPLLLVALFGIPISLRAPRRCFLAITFLFVVVGLFVTIYNPFSAYPAPLLVSFFGLAMLGLRQLRIVSFHGRKIGRWWARGLIVALLLFGAGRLGVNLSKGMRAAAARPAPWNVARAQLIESLTKQGGEHLILVKYLPGHRTHNEWVYNSPDLDKQKVIFARSMGDAEDRSLMRYYGNRTTWMILPDRDYALQPVTFR